ncbi:citrate/2-methylcitrate synthase [Actinomadura atramentaria]|uniref:citrate/2-methylcitrate synthase n=1 Tax=Actinomadura atramentaria TaxID=1990 RepID=UPI00036CB5BD|nr:citrate/2-methylcitrate synthase [Actinomadura atramentaria]
MPEPRSERWIEAAEAAERLGVKPATLYSYVSRGVLRRRAAADGRRSLFDAEQVAELARRGRPRRPPAPSELVIDTALTALGPDRHYYRGRSAVDLAVERTFEEVAAFLWTGAFDPGPDWAAPGAARDAAAAALPPGALPLDRLQLAAVALGVADPLRFRLDADAVTGAGRALIAGMVEALPPLGPPAGPGIAGRLWGRLCPEPDERGLLPALNAALVLLADHELAASTLAARTAASVRADPYAVVAAGLGVLGGPLHGGASYAAERLLAEVGGDPGRAAPALAARLRAGERVPGFGHAVYRDGDARGACLLDLVRAAAPGDARLLAADAVLAEARRLKLPAANVDLALAVLGAVAGFTPGAGQAVFAVARTAGWLAHALEEYAARTPLRPRARYVGPEPGPEPGTGG